MLLDLAAYHLHRAVHQSVLLRERLVHNGQSGRQPTLGELAGIGALAPVSVDLRADDFGRGLRPSVFGHSAGRQLAQQGLAVRHHDGPREGVLVVVYEDLVDVGRLVHDRLLHSFGTVFLAVRGDQQALEPPQHIEKLILGDITHVARVEPSVAYGLGRSLGVLPVSRHDVLTADDDLSLRTAGHLVPFLVEDLQVERDEDLARRTEAVPVVFGRVGRDDGRRLRESVSLKHRDADGVEEALELRIEQGAPADEELHAAAERLADLAEQQGVEDADHRGEQDPPSAAPAVSVLIVDIGRAERQAEEPLRETALGAYRALDVLAEVLGQRRHRQQEVRLHLADVLRDVLERLHRRGADLHRGYRGAAGDHDVEADDVREAVVERQDDERAVVRRDVDARERLLDVGRVVAVREHDPLRIGCRAGGVGDRGVVVVADRLPDCHELLAVFGQIVASEPLEGPEGRFARFEGQVPEDDDVFHPRNLVADAADLRQLVFRDEERLDLGVAQAEEQVVRLLELDRERHADRPGVEESQFGDDPCVAPLGEDRHLVPGADAQRGEPGADLERLLAGFGIGRGLELAVALLEQEGCPRLTFSGKIPNGILFGSVFFSGLSTFRT